MVVRLNIMTLQLTGPISLNDIGKELGNSDSTSISLNDSLSRTLSGKSTGIVALSDFYGKTYKPVFVTNSGNIGSDYTQRVSLFTVSAISDAIITYSLVGGTLPTGHSLNSSTGVISGTASGVSDFTSNTYNFVIRASVSPTIFTDRAFNIIITSRYVGYRCSTAGEGGTCADTAPGSYYFNRVDFCSYGTPNGGCGGFSYSGCNGGYWWNPGIVKSYAVGANNNNFGDPCHGTSKRMYVQMSYGPF